MIYPGEKQGTGKDAVVTAGLPPGRQPDAGLARLQQRR